MTVRAPGDGSRRGRAPRSPSHRGAGAPGTVGLWIRTTRGQRGAAVRTAQGDPAPRPGAGLPRDLPADRDVRVPLGHHPRSRTGPVPHLRRPQHRTAPRGDGRTDGTFTEEV